MSPEVYSGRAVKHAAWQFLTGKAVSAALTFIILLWLVRILPTTEYGAYIVFVAGTEFGFALADLGMTWQAARYLPDYRLNANGRILIRLCKQLFLCQVISLVIFSAIIGIFLNQYLNWINLSEYKSVALIALLLLVFEGAGRFLREGMMAPLMLQGQARLSLVLRQLIFLAIIAILSFSGDTALIWVVAGEVGASAIGWGIAGITLLRHLRQLLTQTQAGKWHEPRSTERWRIALRMHVSRLITLTYSPQVFLNIIQRNLGAEVVALFGFLYKLYRQVAQYLPATLMFTVLRPKFVASYGQGGIAAIALQANLAGKLSLFVLFPIIVMIALMGDLFIAQLSDYKFTGGGLYLAGLLLSLVPLSQRQLIETIAVVVGRAGLCALSSALGLLALPVLIALLGLNFGLWAPVLAILVGEVVFNLTVLMGLAPMGYRSDWRGATKLAFCAVLAWLIGSLVSLNTTFDILQPALACMLAGAVFLIATWWLGVFTLGERKSLDNILGRHLFTR